MLRKLKCICLQNLLFGWYFSLSQSLQRSEQTFPLRGEVDESVDQEVVWSKFWDDLFIFAFNLSNLKDRV